MSKHTPGPYELLPGTDMIFTVGDPYGHGPRHVADVRGWGHMTGQGGGLAWPEEKALATQEANGKLLAASFDLLTIAQEISSLRRTDCNDRECATCTQCRSEAIVKAVTR